MRRLLLIVRIVLAAVFIYAAYTKLAQPWQLFALSISSYQLLPDSASLFIARTLPWAELLIGLLLLIGYRLKIVASIATALLVVFFVIMLRSYGKGMGIDCGCFGVGEPLSAKTLLRDGALLLFSALLTVSAFLRRFNPKPEPQVS